MVRKGFLAVAFGLMIGTLGISSLFAAHRGDDNPDQGKGPNKVKLCHVEEIVELDIGEEAEVAGEIVVGPGTVIYAHVIEVSSNGNAVDAHLAHGDHLLPEDSELMPGDDCSEFVPAEEEPAEE